MNTHSEVWRFLFLVCGLAFAFAWSRRAMHWREFRGRRRRDRDAGVTHSAIDSEAVVALEHRVAELEERLDFTERLLAQRSSERT